MTTATQAHLGRTPAARERDVAVVLEECPAHRAEGWLFLVCLRADCDCGSHPAPSRPRVTAFDLRAGLALAEECRRPLRVFVPRAALDSLCERLDALPVDALAFEPGSALEDETLVHLAELIRPPLGVRGIGEWVFASHLLEAFTTHVAIAYGRIVPGSRSRRGGLANWQLRRAQELLRARLDAPIRIESVAEACRLSPSHFSRAFRRSTGLAPYAWLLAQRVETAKALLRAPARTLSEVAAVCGFADQSHFSRVFQRHVGATPGAWRRLVIEIVQ